MGTLLLYQTNRYPVYLHYPYDANNLPPDFSAAYAYGLRRDRMGDKVG